MRILLLFEGTAFRDRLVSTPPVYTRHPTEGGDCDVSFWGISGSYFRPPKLRYIARDNLAIHKRKGPLSNHNGSLNAATELLLLTHFRHLAQKVSPLASELYSIIPCIRKGSWPGKCTMIKPTVRGHIGSPG